jgi:hypothetical protein
MNTTFVLVVVSKMRDEKQDILLDINIATVGLWRL